MTTAPNKTCIGYGPYEGKCQRPPDLELNPAGLWCFRCEHLRRTTISASMAKITAAFNEAQGGPR